MANFFKRILRYVHWPLREKLIFFIKKNFLGASFSLNKLDKKLEKYVNYDQGFFVELGANDGFTYSNSLYFELKRNWRGVLIEPSPRNFKKCLANRGLNNSIFCNACVGFEYKNKYVDMIDANLMSISNNLDLDLSNKKSHIEQAKKFLRNNEIVFSYKAKSRTLNDVLDEAKAPNIIDFLSLDVEGAELEVLKGVNFKKYKFKYLLIEVRDLKRMQTFLKKYNYYLLDQFSSNDYLFKYSQN